MAKLPSRTELAENPASGDLVHIVDISDTTDDASGTSKKITWDNLNANNRTRYIEIRVVEGDTACAVDTGVGHTFEAPFTGTIIQDDALPYEFCAYTNTAGVTGTMVVDVHLNGSTIMTTNKLDIETGETSSATAVTQPDLTTTAITAGDKITIDIDAIHSGTAANGLTVRIPIRIS